MKQDDIAAVQQIAKISWHDTYEGIIPGDIQNLFIERAYSNAMMMKRLEKTSVYVAIHDEEIIGFANFTRVDEDGDAELTAIYLLPSHQHLGYGKKLLNEGLQHIQDAQQLFVYVESENQKGRAFYERNNFTCIEEFDEFFEGHPLSTAKYVYYLKTPVNS
ncbi:GNAT family N-acetyltransferase [Paenisporosarcina sp. NPDC076898]|uniref:GNAT family N-acetyltransferase n=1 Tax=unclassified Paenisporosarcina TaxID=2642018 RepID=UPI003D04886F